MGDATILPSTRSAEHERGPAGQSADLSPPRAAPNSHVHAKIAQCVADLAEGIGVLGWGGATASERG